MIEGVHNQGICLLDLGRVDLNAYGDLHTIAQGKDDQWPASNTQHGHETHQPFS
jgi:hypothetical protein